MPMPKISIFKLMRNSDMKHDYRQIIIKASKLIIAYRLDSVSLGDTNYDPFLAVY